MATVVPGGQTALTLRVRNTGEIVERFAIEIIGLPDEWVTIDSPAVNVDTAAERSVTISLHPPRTSSTAFGSFDYEVVVRSTVNPQIRASERGALSVGGFSDPVVHLEPLVSSGRRTTRHRLTIANRGNAPVDVAIAATPADAAIEVRPQRPDAQIAPGQSATLDMTVVVRKPSLLGSQTAHPFLVTVTPTVGNPIETSATMTQVPLIPRWVPAAIMIVLAGSGLAYALTRKTDHLLSTAADTRAATTLAPGASTTGSTSPQTTTVTAPTSVAATSTPTSAASGVGGGGGGTAVPVKIPIPDLASVSYDEAKAVLAGSPFIVTSLLEKTEQSKTIAAGLVTRTDPPKTTKITPGQPITVFVSIGFGDPIPNVSGLSLTDATTKITTAGFVVDPIKAHQNSTAIAVGQVIGTTQTGLLPKTSTIQLITSSGNGPVVVPNETGKTTPAAIDELTNLGFEVATTSTYLPTGNPAIGHVISMTPVAGTAAAPNSKISLTVGTVKFDIGVLQIKPILICKDLGTC